MTIYILLILAAVGTGMAISVYAFGTGGKRKRIFQDIYFSVEDNEGVGVVYTKNGEYAAILRMEIPVDKYWISGKPNDSKGYGMCITVDTVGG